MSNVTKRTSAGTDVAENHKGGSAVAKTLTEIRAARFFADSVQSMSAKDLL